MTKYADSHLHPDGLKYTGIEDAALLSVCTAQFSDWDLVQAIDDERVIKSYGVHPWYADSWGDDSLDRLRITLKKYPEANVGEIGLDSVKGPSMVDQARCFEEQLSLAAEMGRTVSIHNVRCENWILAAVRRNRKGCRAIVLHSFTGPESYISSFSKLDCYFSVSPRLLMKREEVARKILEGIPKDRLLIETDALDIGNGFESMDAFIQGIADMLEMKPAELAKLTLANAKRAFQ